MKKQCIAVFVAIIALTTYSCRESKDESVQDTIEDVQEEIQEDVQEESDDLLELDTEDTDNEVETEETVSE